MDGHGLFKIISRRSWQRGVNKTWSWWPVMCGVNYSVWATLISYWILKPKVFVTTVRVVHLEILKFRIFSLNRKIEECARYKLQSLMICILLFLWLVLWTYLSSQCFVNRVVSKIDTVAFVSWTDKARNSTVDPCSRPDLPRSLIQ
jgi:hypothetical protein